MTDRPAESPAAPRTRTGSVAGAIVVLALAALLAIEVRAAYALSITYDEFATIGAGYADVKHGRVELFPEYPPLERLLVGETLVLLGARSDRAETIYPAARTQMLAQWGYCETLLLEDNRAFRFPFARPGIESVVVAARLPLVIFPVLVALVAFLWARARHGDAAGLVALALALGYPDLLAQGALVKHEAPFAFFALLAGYALEMLATRGGAGWLATAALALGGAVASRLSAPFLVLGFVAAVVALLVRGPTDPAPASGRHPFGHGDARTRARAVAASAALVLALAGALAWAAYLGANPVTGFLAGVHRFGPQLAGERERSFAGSVYELPAALYFFHAALFKTPLGMLAVFGLAVAAARTVRAGLGGELLAHAPAVALLGSLVALASPYGTRYLVPVVPFFIVSAARVAPWAARSRARAVALGVALAATVGATLASLPFCGDFTNALAGPRELVYRRLDNSNVDWGGGLEALAAWQRARGIRSVAVVPYAAQPIRLVPPDAQVAQWRFAFASCPRLAALREYGVAGEQATAAALVWPERGKVYAVSAHVVSRGFALEREIERRPWPAGTRPRIVLGCERLPDAWVGGFLIFDLREK